jgi:IclR family acetate operon transcriptional repressor
MLRCGTVGPFRSLTNANGYPYTCQNSVLLNETPVSTLQSTSGARSARSARTQTARRKTVRAGAGTEVLELPLRLLEHLVDARESIGVSDLARTFDASKATVYRHLRALAKRGYVQQDPVTQRYAAGVKLFILGERLRDRFDVLGAARQEMVKLRDETGQAVTLSTLVENQAVVLELLQGHTIVEFGTRPGTALDLHASAHGKVALAFGPPDLIEQCTPKTMKAWTPQTLRTRAALERAVAQVRTRGYSTAANEVLPGVNALAAPIFDHRGGYAGALAIVGSTQYIAAQPSQQQLALVTGAAQRVSRALGWKPR